MLQPLPTSAYEYGIGKVSDFVDQARRTLVVDTRVQLMFSFTGFTRMP